MNISPGFPDEERDTIAQMYWTAFGQKLGHVMGPAPRAIAFFSDILDPAHALCARTEDGLLLGVAGFKTHKGALAGGKGRDLMRHYGLFGSTWRIVLLALLERDTEEKRFLMDGIFVQEAAQGQGVGTALLDAICDEARARGFTEVRLDVIDTNPRARALYERRGFVAGDVQHLGPLRHIFGFRYATVMVRQIGPVG